MREIKFRAWDATNKIWRQPCNSLRFNAFHGQLETNTDDTSAQIIPEQYTGLKDKNGVEIYEGDIFEDDEDGSINWVEYDADFAGFTTTDGKGGGWYAPKDLADYTLKGYLEVIGNIHENPELLHD